MRLKEIMSSDVKWVSSHTLVSRAAEIMRASNVGCLPVVDRGGVVGLFTDRDIVVRAIGRDKDPTTTPVSEIMTPKPKHMNHNANVCDAVTLMRNNRVRRVPVVNDEGLLVGMVTLTDVALRAREPIQSGSALVSICAKPALVI